VVRGDAARRALRRIVEAGHGARHRRATERLRRLREAERSQIGRRTVPAEEVLPPVGWLIRMRE
jgi:hypothetical protein